MQTEQPVDGGLADLFLLLQHLPSLLILLQGGGEPLQGYGLDDVIKNPVPEGRRHKLPVVRRSDHDHIDMGESATDHWQKVRPELILHIDVEKQ